MQKMPTPRPDEDRRARRLRQLLVARGPARSDSALEAGGGAVDADAPLPPADEILGRVEAILRRMPPDEVAEEAAFRQALDTLLRHGDAALKRLVNPRPEGGFDLDSDQLASLEAIVIADGSRPSFLLREGRVAADHPFLGTWGDRIGAAADTLCAVASCVGRIEPGNGSAASFIGTGTLIDRERGLVLTNYHVIDDARTRFGVAMTQSGDELRVVGDLLIDFAGEIASIARRRWRVVQARLPAGAGRLPGELDAAVLHIEPHDPASGELAARPARLSADVAYATGASPTLCTIGFSGPPVQLSPPGGLIDWDFVVATLFGNRFGYKRLAPGRFQSPPGSLPNDTAQRVLTHDATTFGGASGSLLLAWEDAAAPAFGLHFAGKTGSANHAVALALATTALKSVGVALED